MPALAVFGSVGLLCCEKGGIFFVCVGVLLPSLAHLNLRMGPPEPPHIICEVHFSIYQDFLWPAVKKGGGIARQESSIT